MSQTEKLTNQDVHYLLGTIDIAEGETGGDYSDLKNKLFALYPQVKKETDDYAKREQRASDEQDKSRKHVTKLVFDGLYLNVPILPQLKTWISFESNYDLLRKHCSDDICLSADLWKYHLVELKRAGLLSEIRDHMKAEAEKPENYWMKDMSETESDEDLWHKLARYLESARE